MRDCVLTGNRAVNGGGAYAISGSQNVAGIGGSMGPTYRHVCTTPNPGGAGMITDDPRLINRSDGDFRPGFGSPCIDNGATPATAVTSDLDGHPRPVSV